MRIHVNLPLAGSSSSTTASSTTASSSTVRSLAPPPLTALTPQGELILIELQGSLEIENQNPRGGQVLGTISFEPTRPDRPVLMISHHRLEGKFVNLVRPLAVLEKKVRADKQVLADVGNASRRRSREEVEAIGVVGTVKRAKRPVEDVGGAGRSSSPPISPKRARDALDFSSSPPRQTPVKSRPLAKASGLTDIDENAEQRGGAQEANQGKEDEEEEEEEEDDQGEEPQTAVYYDVVNVIKRKILFSKRPEPIVRLDTSPTAVRTAKS
ncbi:hypothetical protein EX895_005585 [Sporisorium graminicola]|uniref:Chromosome transmission fidelity protein 8 n=1 Tax=Sporisorium graminicola TaxID=280036 RepID=A0A4U7KMU9_9BASI|nr:hypothetical protein EX895_005585 [Sporisorium graminicola]TKY85423.1 hypothetical protein EX895_005585 [Sporisorium graminicola]